MRKWKMNKEQITIIILITLIIVSFLVICFANELKIFQTINGQTFYERLNTLLNKTTAEMLNETPK